MHGLPTLWQVLIWAPPIILAITLHEVGHGWAAKQLGDDTADRMGRLTANPLSHIDPVGSVLIPGLLLLTKAGFLFGWAKPVPINWRNLRHPRRDIALVALAGPAANLLMLLGWVVVIWLAAHLPIGHVLAQSLVTMGQVGIVINSILIAFNLIPLPPLDGSRVMMSLLPPALAQRYMRLEPYGLLIVVILLMLGWLSFLVQPVLMLLDRLVSLLLS
jgi:Zn-dependent protease